MAEILWSMYALGAVGFAGLIVLAFLETDPVDTCVRMLRSWGLGHAQALALTVATSGVLWLFTIPAAVALAAVRRR